MADTLSKRTQQLHQLSEYIKHTKNKILHVINQLEWDETQIQKQEKEMVSCPLNGEHRVPQEKLQQHVESCSWRTESYHDLDTPLPERFGAGIGSVTIGKTLRNAILQEAVAKDPNMKLGFTGVDTRPLPKTADRLVADFTPDERRAMYDYAVARTGLAYNSKTDLPMEFQKEDDQKEKPKTILERLAEERDAKRRRVSYRNKKVHTNRKSQTEIMQEVIQNQMELYEEWLKQENKDALGATALEEHASTVEPTDPDKERSSSSSVVEHSRVHTEPRIEERKVPYQYIAKLRRKMGNPYAIAREISDYMKNLSQEEVSVDESNSKHHNQDVIDAKSGDRYADRYQNQNSSTSAVKEDNHHKRSRTYEYECDRSYKSEKKVYDSHHDSDQRKNSSSPENEKYRNPGAEQYNSSRYYGGSSNTNIETRTKYSQMDRPYSPKREHRSKYHESNYKRDRRSSLERRRSDYNRSYEDNQEKRYETSEYRIQGSNSYSVCSSHRKYAETTYSSREKDDSAYYRKYRKEKCYESRTESRHRKDSRSPEYHSGNRKHERHKHRHAAYKDKHKNNDSSESPQLSGKFSESDASHSEESNSDKKDVSSVKDRTYARSYEDESGNNTKQKYLHEDQGSHHKHKHKKKHKKKKKRIKHERIKESECSSTDFSC